MFPDKINLPRKMYRSLALDAIVIADVERVRSSYALSSERSQTPSQSGPRSKPAAIVKALMAVAAVALVTMTLGRFLPGRDGESKIITIKALNGPVEWTGNGGRMTEELIVGRELTGGTIELASAASWIEFAFRDRSTVTLSGPAVATLSEQGQKELRLKHGSLSASIKPQPADRPMLVYTSSAELKVLGTQFNVDALADATRLAVNAGRVRLTRLTDGKEVDVPARHAVMVSMQDPDGLPLKKQVDAVPTWKSDLKADVIRGKWASDLWMLGVKLKDSVADGEMNKADAVKAYKSAATLDDESGSVWAEASSYGSLVQLSATRSGAAPVGLKANARFRIKGQLHSRVSVKFGISTRTSDGGFAGKFSVAVADGDLYNNGNEFEIELPLSRFHAGSAAADSPIGTELCDWWCLTHAMSAKLEISSVELVDP